MTDEILRDEILSKEQFKELLGHMPIFTKSAALLMYSSGIRVGEALLLGVDDLHLDEDPPYADVRAEYTMRRSGDRRAHFSYETRDAIEEWLKVKKTRVRKIIEGPEELGLVFGYSMGTWMYSWNKACEKANLRLSTHPKVRVTTHTLRRCFRLNMLKAGMPDEIVHALMGHRAYLDDAESGITLEEIARTYKEHMGAVSVYEAEEIQPIESPDSTPGDKANSGGKEGEKLNDF